MNARRAIVLLVYLMSATMSVAVAKHYTSDKRVQRPVGFNTMMRYGRASPKDPRVPRAGGDLFFLGPRYGKRSSEWSPPPPPSSPNASSPVAAATLTCRGDLACAYTGVADLYRCALRKNHLGYNSM